MAGVTTATGPSADLFLPEPEPRPVQYTVISVDDHLVEPPDMFEGRLPAKLQPLAPKVVETAQGHEVWEFDGERYSQVGMNAVAGRRPETVKLEPFRFEQMRPGCYDIDARIRDMDINGVWASLNFPSMITGFCGRVFSQCKDPELGIAVTRAWNDWLYEAWYSPYPERIIPLGITYLSDPEVGAEEIRRNAARGFTSITLPERPHRIGYPSLYSGYWDPIVQACAETGTVISLHVGSSGMYDFPPDGPFLQLGATLFGQLSLTACAEWLWSGYPVRFPDLKIAMSEGGIGWVAMLLDRLDNVVDRSGYGMGWDERPAD
ncbi:MAG: amidohydrolase family protein, partial [Actinobacteria bacterium]|nr:amidohydrolase family protein [Actinomycetota bacterium]